MRHLSRLFWRRYLRWFPYQPCIGCPRWHFSGSHRGYCSRVCHDNAEHW